MKKKTIAVIAAVVVVSVLVFVGIWATRNLGKTEKVVDTETAEESLEKLVRNIRPTEGTPVKSAVEPSSEEVTEIELPDIDTCEIVVEPTTDFYAEIFCSPEKAGTGTDGWLVEMAEAYNSAGRIVDGRPASIEVRNVSSGQALDYITSGTYIPDGYTPSNDLWIEMLEAKGVDTEVISEKLLGNVAGLVFKKDKYEEFVQNNGSSDIKSIIQAVENGELMVGYTNPFTSSSGLNFLLTTLVRYGGSDILSDTAQEGFKAFQKNIPFVAMTTIQMREAAERGTLDAFILEYQSFVNDSSLRDNYVFIPYGYRHDNPLVTFESTNAATKAILQDFATFCTSESAHDLAMQYGFNGMEDYKSDMPAIDGNNIVQAQKLYKKNKDSGVPVVAVFVTDVSGSMEGDPILGVKNSLVNSMKYINADNYIGLVSYSGDVTIEMPIQQFDLNTQSLFKGSVEQLDANGSTAIYDGILVGASMINDFIKENPNTKPMLFLLSDGENVQGASYQETAEILQALNYPVYTIGYNANIPVLQEISAINEAASINAETDDIVYKLKTLFEANM